MIIDLLLISALVVMITSLIVITIAVTAAFVTGLWRIMKD